MRFFEKLKKYLFSQTHVLLWVKNCRDYTSAYPYKITKSMSTNFIPPYYAPYQNYSLPECLSHIQKLHGSILIIQRFGEKMMGCA